MKTRLPIEYHAAPYGYIVLIPAGTPVIPISNLPDEEGPRYWAEPWPGMDERAESYQRNYGFVIESHEVE
jgi:hypothetical protein